MEREEKHPWSQPTDWGVGAWVTKDFARWKNAATKTEGNCIAWDELTTNGGRDRDNLGAFTEIRHDHPVLLVMGHRFDAMLPTMRTCLTDLILARCMPEDAAKWASEMVDRDIMRATELEQYQFLWKRAFKPVEIVRFTPQQIAYGLQL